MVGFEPKIHAFKSIAIDSVECHSWVQVSSNFLHGEHGDVVVQSVVHRTNHLSGCQRIPKAPVEVDDAAVDANMNSSVGST